MKIWQIAFVSMLLAACAPKEIRCDSHLTAINSPGAKASSQRSTTELKP
jgi:hypothetical protein